MVSTKTEGKLFFLVLYYFELPGTVLSAAVDTKYEYSTVNVVRLNYKR